MADLARDDVADGAEPAAAPDPVRQGVVHEDLPRHTENDPRLHRTQNKRKRKKKESLPQKE